MNKKILITDLITLAFGIITFSVVQLVKAYGSALASNPIFIISFALALILYGAFFTLFSYKNSSDNVAILNLAIQLIFALSIAVLFILHTKGIIFLTVADLSVCITFFALFASRFMFSLSIYTKEYGTKKPLKTSNEVKVSLKYSKNMSDEPHENFETAGYIILVLGALALIAVTIDCFYPLF